MNSLLKVARAEKAINVLGAILGVLFLSLSLFSQRGHGFHPGPGVIRGTSRPGFWPQAADPKARPAAKIGRASCRERV